MKKENFYRIIILALLLLNFGILGYLWKSNGNEHRPPQHVEPAGLIIDRLQLDAKQQSAFEELKHAHQQASRKLRDESRELHDALFNTLTNADTGAVDSLMVQIAKNDEAKELLNYHHFKELKTILKPEQYHLYDEFIEDIARQFGPRQGPPPGERPPRH
jgi:hypothetical protein